MRFEHFVVRDSNEQFVHKYNLVDLITNDNEDPQAYLVDTYILQKVGVILFDQDDFITDITFIYHDTKGLKVFISTIECDYDHEFNDAMIDRVMKLINESTDDQLVNYLTMILVVEP